MSKLDDALTTIDAVLATDLGVASGSHAVIPFDIEPEELFASPDAWPADGGVAFAVVDRGVVGEKLARGSDLRRTQTSHPEIQVWMKAATLSALMTLFNATRRQVFVSLQTIERDYSYSHNRWTVSWEDGGAKASRVNTGFQATLRVGCLVEFFE